MDWENDFAVSEREVIDIKIIYTSERKKWILKYVINLAYFFVVFTIVLTFKTITDITKVTKLQVIFLLEV